MSLSGNDLHSFGSLVFMLCYNNVVSKATTKHSAKKERTMKFICPVCGLVEEGYADRLPLDYKCPVCKVPR